MKKHLSTIILIGILLAGVSLLLYPGVSDYWNRVRQSQAIADYTKSVGELDDMACEELWMEAEQYNSFLRSKANRYHFTEEEHEEYEQLLNVAGDGIMGYIEIASINCYLPIYHGVDEEVLRVAAGHIEGTSMPTGGPGTHCVLSGHRGLPSARLFTDLDQLKEGDVFVLRVLDKSLAYEVDQIRIVLPEELEDLSLEDGMDYCTLVTCTPYGVNSHRLLVRGHRIGNLSEASPAGVAADAMQMKPMLITWILMAPVLLLMTVWLLVRRRRR